MSDQNSQIPVPITWTPELVRRFWDGFSQTRLIESSFALLGGHNLIFAVQHMLSREDKILDYGAGDGHLVRLLCQQGFKAAAYEPSATRKKTLMQALEGQNGFLGVMDADSTEVFDAVILSEVIEHILETDLDSFLHRFNSLVKPGGTIIVTSPNSEELDRDVAYCPCCNTLFHRWQHVRSLDKDSLPALLAKYGFEEIVTHRLDFSDELLCQYENLSKKAGSQANMPLHVLDIRANRPVKIGGESRLLYLGKKRVMVEDDSSLEIPTQYGASQNEPGLPVKNLAEEASYASFYNDFAKALPVIRYRRNRLGAAHFIGSLACGGAERQMMLTIKSTINKNSLSPINVGIANADEERHHFFAPDIANCGASVFQIPRESSCSRINKIVRALGKLPQELSGVKNYAEEIARLNPAVVHAWMDEINIKAGLAAVALGVPRIVLSMRNLPPYHFSFYQPWMKEGYRWLSKQPGVVMLNNSQAGAEAYEEWLMLPPGTIRVIHNAFSVDEAHLQDCLERRKTFRAGLGIPDDARFVGGVLRFSPEKRPLLWLETAEKVHRTLPDVHFLLLGTGPLEQTISEKVGRQNLEGHLHIQTETINALEAIAAMDMLLLTSSQEGLPNVLLEAQALGVPVVTTDAGGAKEAVLHERSGWVLDDDDPGELAATIVRLLENREWMAQASQIGKTFVRQEFNLQKMANDTLDAYGPQHSDGFLLCALENIARLCKR